MNSKTFSLILLIVLIVSLISFILIKINSSTTAIEPSSISTSTAAKTLEEVMDSDPYVKEQVDIYNETKREAINKYLEANTGTSTR